MTIRYTKWQNRWYIDDLPYVKDGSLAIYASASLRTRHLTHGHAYTTNV